MAATPSPRTDLLQILMPSEATGFPDYSVWNANAFARWPGFTVGHHISKERKWWWLHGFRMIDSRKQPPNNYVWVCETCFHEGKSPGDCKFAGSTSKSIENHMRAVHSIIAPIKDDPSTRPPRLGDQRTLDDIVDRTNPYEQALHAKIALQFNTKMNNLLILDWLVHSNLRFSIVDDTRWRRQQLYNNSLIEDDQLPSRQTLVRLVLAEYRRAIEPVRQLLQTARGMIHITFDGWTSRRSTSFIGIHAHFVDVHWKRWSILLGLPALVGKHTGIDIADEVIAIIIFFGITDKVGYCTLDNESKNDTCMVAIGDHFGFDGVERRIRCAPHTLQLSVRALLYGDGCKRLPLDRLMKAWGDQDFEDSVEEDEVLDKAFDEAVEYDGSDDESDGFSNDEFNEETDLDQAPIKALATVLEEYEYPVPKYISKQSLERYEKHGPLGKLHNTGNCFHNSSQLVGALHDAQQAANPNLSVKCWVHNNSTRWQSDEAMAARALEIKLPLNKMMNKLEEDWQQMGAKQDQRPRVLTYRLSPTEWVMVEAIQR